VTATLLALAAGALVGLALGGLGGGGSMLAVPALVYLLGFSQRQAASAALVIVALTSVGGLLAHLRTGTCRCRAGALFAAAGLPFAAAAGLLSAHLPGALLTAGFAVVAALAAWRMLRTDGAYAPPGPAAGASPPPVPAWGRSPGCSVWAAASWPFPPLSPCSPSPWPKPPAPACW